MKVVKLIFWFVLFLSAFDYDKLSAQKKSIDFTSNTLWPKLLAPSISPDGRYTIYGVNNYPVGMNSAIIKSNTNNWSINVFYNKPDYLDCGINNQYAVFLINEDTLGIVKLGKEIEYFVGYTSYKLSQGPNFNYVCALNKNKLLLLDNSKKIYFDNILDYHFVENGSKLLLHKFDGNKDNEIERIILVDLITMTEVNLWNGYKAKPLVLNSKKDKVAFLSGDKLNKDLINSINYITTKGNDKFTITNNKYKGYSLSDLKGFNKDEKNLILYLKEIDNHEYKQNKLKLKIWSYKDPVIQSAQIKKIKKKEFLACVSINRKELVKIEEPNDDWNLGIPSDNWGNNWLVSQTIGDCDQQESFWSLSCLKKWYLVDISNSYRKRITALENRNRRNQNWLSPNEKFIIFYDYDSTSYYQYNIETNSIKELTKGSLKLPFLVNKYSQLSNFQRGVAGWNSNGRSVLIYDNSDIWEFSLLGEFPPRCLTKGLGVKNNIVFGLLENSSNQEIDSCQSFILRALNTNNKENGFYKTTLSSQQSLVLLTMGPYIYYIPASQSAEHIGMNPVKAKYADVYIVKRESSREFPNYYLTRDFRSFKKLSTFSPEVSYKWMSTQLITWSLPNGTTMQGVLYKPDDFDSTKKYPMIINTYEKFSNSLNAYIPPEPLCYGCNVNPAILISNGYLLFKPDIYFKTNYAGESALITIESAIKYLSQFSWIDSNNIGLQGCSFGGFTTNYIVTHSKLIKAACSASGVSDILSFGSSHYDAVYTSFNWGQLRFNKMIWDDASLFLNNSAVFRVPDVTTPLLLFHTTVDDAVPFNQGIEFYLMLRKLNKPVWLLEYSDANHGVFDPDQSRDFGLRMLQFFNYYLKEKSIPIWMRDGIKAEESENNDGLGY